MTIFTTLPLLWIKWLQQHMLACPSVKYFGMECPGCGMQRSIIALLQGNLHYSLQVYPALIPLAALCIYTMFHLKYKFASGSKVITALQLFVVVIITAHYIYKIISHQIFH